MTTFEKILDVFESVFEGSIALSGITEQSMLTDDLGINSIGMLYMAMALEEEFDIKFKNEDVATLRTVGDVIACIESKH